MKKRTNPEFEMVIKNSRTNDDSGEGERSVVYNQQRYFTIFIFILWNPLFYSIDINIDMYHFK